MSWFWEIFGAPVSPTLKTIRDSYTSAIGGAGGLALYNIPRPWDPPRLGGGRNLGGYPNVEGILSLRRLGGVKASPSPRQGEKLGACVLQLVSHARSTRRLKPADRVPDGGRISRLA